MGTSFVEITLSAGLDMMGVNFSYLYGEVNSQNMTMATIASIELLIPYLGLEQRIVLECQGTEKSVFKETVRTGYLLCHSYGLTTLLKGKM